MHELSIAMSIIDIATEEAEQRQARVAAVHLKLGPLAGVVKEALLSAYELAREDTVLSNASLEIEDVPIRIQCPDCNTEQPVVDLQDLRCSACGAPAADIISGRELEVVAMEIMP